MKTIYGYIGILIAVCLLQACESDLDKAYYSDGTGSACCIGGFTGNVYHQPAATK